MDIIAEKASRRCQQDEALVMLMFIKVFHKQASNATGLGRN